MVRNYIVIVREINSNKILKEFKINLPKKIPDSAANETICGSKGIIWDKLSKNKYYVDDILEE